MEKHTVKGDFLYKEYSEYFSGTGVELIPVSNWSLSPGSIIDSCHVDGLILSGGTSIGAEAQRDRTEHLLLKSFLAARMPVLGICRGMQFLNYYFSGKLPAKIAETRGGRSMHVKNDHKISIIDNRLKDIIGSAEAVVNSYHNFGFRSVDISEGLTIAAVSKPDDIIEAVMHESYPILGIQWHPERISPDDHVNDRLIRGFMNGAIFRSEAG